MKQQVVFGVVHETAPPLLLRVKRPKTGEELENIYLEYDGAGNIKRTRLVTQKEAMESALNLFTLETPKQSLLLQKTNLSKVSTPNV